MTETVAPENVQPRPGGVKAYPYAHQEGNFPLIIEPGEGQPKDAGYLQGWLQAHKDWLRGELVRSGAILIRGFDLDTASAFERCLLTVDDGLQNFYLGTSPRLRLTDYVFTASELPWYYTIPQHCEMSFIKTPPARIYFFCMVPARQWGETPLVDFRTVYNEMDPEIRQTFEEKGIRNVRNYYGPAGKKNPFDVTDYKRWDEMFLTTDRAKVEEIAGQEGFECVWKDNDRLALVNTQPAIIEHPETGEKVWFNHLLPFHDAAASQVIERTAKRLKSPMMYGLWGFGKALVAYKRATAAPEDQATQCFYGDGTPIPDEVVAHIRDVAWRNMIIFTWRKNDMALIDNRLISHGRRPFRGDRFVAVAWG